MPSMPFLPLTMSEQTFPFSRRSAADVSFPVARTNGQRPDVGDLLKEEDEINVHVTSTEELEAYLSELDDADVRALVASDLSSDELRMADEHQLRDILLRIEWEKAKGRVTTPVPDELLDSFTEGVPQESGADAVPDTEELSKGTMEVEVDSPLILLSFVDETTASLLVLPLAMSCIFAILTIALGFGFYSAVMSVRRGMDLPSPWYALSKLELGKSTFVVPASDLRPRKATKGDDANSVPCALFDYYSVYDRADEYDDDTDTDTDTIYVEPEEVDLEKEKESRSVYATPLLGPVSLPLWDEDDEDGTVQLTAPLKRSKASTPGQAPQKPGKFASSEPVQAWTTFTESFTSSLSSSSRKRSKTPSMSNMKEKGDLPLLTLSSPSQGLCIRPRCLHPRRALPVLHRAPPGIKCTFSVERQFRSDSTASTG